MIASNRLWTAMNNNERFFEELGKRIVARRKELGMTQTDLGNKIGVTQQVVASYETALCQIPVFRLPSLVSVLDISLDDLLGIQTSGEKRGPKSKLEKQLEAVRQLPKTEQEFVSQFIDKIVSRSS